MKRLLLAITLLLAVAATARAQEFRTGYFLENYSYAYRINPAAPIEGKPYFFAGLGLGNVTAEAHTNLSLPSFIARDKNGELAFPLLSSDFTMEQALSGLSSVNDLGLNLNMNLLTIGWQGQNNRITAEVNLRSDSYLFVPIDMFSLVKLGLSSLADSEFDQKYSFAGLDVGTDLYTELAVGYTQRIGDMLTVGGRIKGLFGIASVGAGLDFSVQPGLEKDIAGAVDGTLHVAAPITVPIGKFDYEGKQYYDIAATDVSDLSGLWNQSAKGTAGWGLGFDLGVTFEPIDGLYLSAAVNDLGFINWNCSVNGHMFYDSNTMGELDSEDYKTILAMEVLNGGRYTTALNYSIHAGAKYKMPFYDRLSVGLLGTMQRHYKEARLGLDITPLDFISLAGSAALSNYGGSLGAALNLKFPIVNFFIGTDAFFFNLTRQFIPVDPVNSTVTVGLLLAI